MAIPLFGEDVEVISKLGTRPGNENGLTTQQVKERFDLAAVRIKNFLNNTLIPLANMTIDVQALLDGILDATLSMADKAAPAKTVGEKIDSVVKTAEAALPKSGGTMTGGVNMSNQQLTGIPDPTTEYDASNKRYVDSKKVRRTVILLPDNWDDKSQTVEIAAVTTENDIIPSFALESIEAGRLADVRCTAQGEGTLTFTCRWIPSEAITMNILILN